MSDQTCINCGSSKITQLDNSDLISSQPIVKELIRFKKQKEKQLKSNTKYFGVPGFQSKKNFLDIFLLFSIFISILFIPQLFYVLVIVITLFSCIKKFVFNPIAISIKFLLDKIRYLRNSLKYKNQINKINRKINKCSSLYYCYDCDLVMDLEEKRCEQSENTNRLIKKIVDI